jgi:hypothetical protein
MAASGALLEQADRVERVSDSTAGSRKASTASALTEPRFSVLTLRDGLIVRIDAYREREQALEAAAGLRE